MKSQRAVVSQTRPENERTDELLTLIEDWLADVGVLEFSLRSAAKAAGVSAPTLLRHFGSREGLLGAIVRHRVDRVVDALKIYIGQKHSIIDAFRQANTADFSVDLRETRINAHVRSLARSAGGDVYREVIESRQRGIKELGRIIAGEGVPMKRAMEIARFIATTGNGCTEDYALHGDAKVLRSNIRILNVCAVQLIEAAMEES